ncbi:hypothetical protein [Mycobacterium branderi]|nr:hypothetical protein [Mycobacterium branderi]MCV7236249.1 hypothetical protein [Mycobacterium branderi]
MSHSSGPTPVDTTVQPHWQRTGYKFFPYAAELAGQWWVLRANYCFPEHDLCTLFIDSRAVADVTGSPDDPRPLIASIAGLHPITPWVDAGVPTMAPGLAEAVVAAVADFVVHGSQSNDPCDLCEFAERDPYERAPASPGESRDR